jgi:hypothetical protein
MKGAVKITKEQIKSEIDKVRDENLAVLYRVVLALEEPTRLRPVKAGRVEADEISWRQFVADMYGSMADAPIERGAQGTLESRLAFDE